MVKFKPAHLPIPLQFVSLSNVPVDITNNVGDRPSSPFWLGTPPENRAATQEKWSDSETDNNDNGDETGEVDTS
ncbi:hypothetical protein B9Z19DRAFT_1126124 [Tuber borchii]|uniref:Uncharacterized protein n=1 Tax=Tuber borchii TaxID=42251 RepID=A0A2T6ZTG8_TUBBO|nr:hypothetical protein B9Z19DRAFT_1126124 [Tuber borchii]